MLKLINCFVFHCPVNYTKFLIFRLCNLMLKHSFFTMRHFFARNMHVE